MSLKGLWGTNSEPEEQTRPRIVLKEQIQLPGRVLYLLHDTETNIDYITGTGADCPVTPLLDADGTPYTG